MIRKDHAKRERERERDKYRLFGTLLTLKKLFEIHYS